jgi:hypothetical protein
MWCLTKAFKSIQEREREREREREGSMGELRFRRKQKGKDAVRRLMTEQGETRFFSKFLRCPPNSKLDFQI